MDIRENQSVDEVRNLVLAMGGLVESALDEAMQALSSRNLSGLLKVHQIETKINQSHMSIDEACLHYLATQGPKAKDLRWVLSMVKANVDLERMGDQCKNIAHNAKDFLNRDSRFDLQDLENMSVLVRKMVKDSLDCFVRESSDLAKQVLEMDDDVDQLKKKIVLDVEAHLKTPSADVGGALDMLTFARNLERMGDHATNIAEGVIFVSTGKDIRHGGSQS